MSKLPVLKPQEVVSRLEALGDLLRSEMAPHTDAKRLAARAYLKASYEVKDEAARQGYRKLAERALQMQTPDPYTTGQLKVAELEAGFATELADAEQWYAELKQKEIGWIRDGLDADAAFDRLYAEEPKAPDETADNLVQRLVGSKLAIEVGVGVGIVACGLVVGFVVLRLIRRLTHSTG